MGIDSKIISSVRRTPIELIFVCGFLLHFGIMYPGFMSYDAVNQILEAREGLYSDWHPPLMAIIWRFSEKIIPGPAGMLFLQIGLIWLGAALVFRSFFKACRPKVAALLLSLIFFIPPILGISGAILKDVLMWGALLTAFGVAGHIDSTNPSSAWTQPGLLVLTILMLWFAILLRHNAVFATLPILSFAIFRLYPKNHWLGLVRAIIPAAMSAAALFAVSGNINKQLADRHTQPWVASAAFDIAGVIKRLDDQTAQQSLFNQLAGLLNSTGSVEPLLKAYTPMYWREIFRTNPPTLELPKDAIGAKLHGFESFSDEQLDGLRKLWTQTIFSEPILWLRHRLAVSAYVLGWAPDSNWSQVIMGKDFPLDLEQDYGSRPVSTKLQDRMEAGIYTLIDDWFFQPWPYFALLIGTLLISMRRSVATNVEVICLAGSGLLHELGLMLAAPSPDFRYSHYMVYCGFLSLLLLARPYIKPVSQV